MAKIAAEEERMRIAFQKSVEDSKAEAQQQVFIDDHDPRRLYEMAFAVSKPEVASTDADAEGADLKTYIADNGQRYVWDEEENDWVEADDDDESAMEAVTNGAGIGNKNGISQHAAHTSAARKRKTAGAEDNDDSGEEAEETAADAGGAGKTGTDAAAKPKKRRSKKKAKKGPNTWVYVSGLPPDVTAEEIKDHFSKVCNNYNFRRIFRCKGNHLCRVQVGLIALSPYDQQPKIKIYHEEPLDSAGPRSANPNTLPCKGDCLICYNAEESVKLAVDVLSGGYIRPNIQVTVTRADFAPGGNGDQGNSGGGAGSGQAQHRRPALSQAQVKVAKSAMKQALTWNEDDDIGVAKSAALRIVVLEGSPCACSVFTIIHQHYSCLSCTTYRLTR
jgi:hypothetical protein